MEIMIQRVNPKFVPMYIKKDPVRPHISAESRMGPGRDIYHIDEKAFVCLAYLDRVPADEDTLLSANVGPVVVAYTVWSLEKGMGRQIILDLQKMIRETYRIFGITFLERINISKIHLGVLRRIFGYAMKYSQISITRILKH